MDRVLVHATTFSANALAMTAGLATLAVIEDEHLVSSAERTGNAMRDALAEMIPKYDLIADVRGRGLMIGLEFGRPKSLRLRTRWSVLQTARRGLFAQMVVMSLFQRHQILTQVAADHTEVIKLLPPLNAGDAEVKQFLDAFAEVMDEAHRGSGLMWDFGRTLVKHAVTR
jgi:4-aminobutyrate aminotransferase-like enzyme